MAGSLPEAGHGAGKDWGGRDVASPTPCGYSPGVRPADLAGRSLSPAEAGRELGQGQPPLPWLGCAPGAGLRCPGGVCPRGRPPLPWWGAPRGDPRSAAGSLCSQH